MPPPPPSIHLLPPPGPSVLLLSTIDSASPKCTSKVPELFLAAHKVRFEVFVREQHCSAANEIDADDATSWHWVIYAYPSPPPPPHPPHDRRAWLESLEKVVLDKSPEEEEEEEDRYFNKNNNNDDNDDEELVSAIPVGTIRLVPFSALPSAVEDCKHDGQAAAPLPPPPSSGEGVEGGGGGGGGGGEGGAEEEQGPTHTPTKMWNGKEVYIKLGRLATLPSHRGLGFGKVLVDTALKWAVENAATLGRQLRGKVEKEKKEEEEEEEEEEWGWNGLVLVHAQRDLEGWYRSVAGFVIDEGLGVWIEEGIEHVGMWRRLDLG